MNNCLGFGSLDRCLLVGREYRSNFHDNPQGNPEIKRYEKVESLELEKPYLITTTLSVTFVKSQITGTRRNFVVEWQWVLDNSFEDIGLDENEVKEDQVDPETHSATNQNWSVTS